jgi:hypothetical protein
VENECCAKYRRISVIKPENILHRNISSSVKTSGSRYSSFDPYELCRDNEKYLMPSSFTATSPGQSDSGARLTTAAKLEFNLMPEIRKNWSQIHPNLSNYHPDPMETSSAFQSVDITD